MSTVSDIYDALVTKVSGIATGYARLPDPYNITENSALIAKKAYGVAIGPGTNTERYVGCFATWQREFTIGLITQVVNTENDVTGRASVEVDLWEIQHELLRSFDADSALGGLVIKATVTSDTGIEYIEGQLSKFLALEIGLSVEYQESLT